MSQNPEELFEEFDGSTYGESMGYDDTEGEFRRTSQGTLRIVDGPQMVGEQLARVLRTPVGTNTGPDGNPPRGSDPFRPEFGLDRQLLLSTTRDNAANAREAIIRAIGPEEIPWVERLDPSDIDVDFDAGNRYAVIQVTVFLGSGTALTFRTSFRALLGQEEFEAADSQL